jgi:hypothetical protein
VEESESKTTLCKLLMGLLWRNLKVKQHYVHISNEVIVEESESKTTLCKLLMRLMWRNLKVKQLYVNF